VAHYQTNKAAEAVPANWTEGFYSQYSTEYLQCLYRCRREGREAQLHLRYASDVGLVAKERAQPILERYEDALRQLNHLIRSIELKIETQGKGKPKDSRFVIRETQEGYEVELEEGEEED
jgi:four helix bundle protein